MNDNDYLYIIKNGKLYYPVSSHYDMNIVTPLRRESSIYYSSPVQCNRCYRNELKICIGYLDKDLCLECCEKIVNSESFKNKKDDIPKYLIKYESNMTAMCQDIFNISLLNKIKQEPYITRMCQDIFNTDESISFLSGLSWMNQDIFNRKKIPKLIKDIDVSTIVISHICLQSNPCKHDVTISGIKSKMYGKQIANKYWEYLDEKQKRHFEKYKSKNLV
jgi:hypothetical protein